MKKTKKEWKEKEKLVNRRLMKCLQLHVLTLFWIPYKEREILDIKNEQGRIVKTTARLQTRFATNFQNTYKKEKP